MTHVSEEQGLRVKVEALANRRFPGAVVRVDAVEGGLGPRRFFRVQLAGQNPSSAIARVELAEDPALRPRGVPPEPPLEPLRRFLEDHGLPVPQNYASDDRNGILLLEDAGPSSLQTAASALSSEERRVLYSEACSWLPRLQSLRSTPDRVAAFGRRLDAAMFAYKADQVIEWVLPWALSRPARPGEAQVVRDAFSWIAQECGRGPARLAHRDYKAANLHLRPNPEDGRRLMMIDLQGAFLAPPEYDLVCLLRDAQVHLCEEEVQEHSSAIRLRLPDAPEAETFARRFTLLTLTRNGKDLARFLYAAHLRGDARYLDSLPHAVESLQRAADRASGWDPRLQDLRELIAQLPAGEGPRTGVSVVTAPKEHCSDGLDEGEEGETPCAG
jgi:aminoglycoside/choline kinase family phosphotransferase